MNPKNRRTVVTSVLVAVFALAGCVDQVMPDQIGEEQSEGAFHMEERGVAWVYVTYLVPHEGESARVSFSFQHEHSDGDEDNRWYIMDSAITRAAEPGVFYHSTPYNFVSNQVFPWGSRTVGGQNPVFVQAGRVSIDHSTDGSEIDRVFIETGQTAVGGAGGTMTREFPPEKSWREAMGASEDEEIWGHILLAERFGSPLEKASEYSIEWSGTEVGFAYGDGSRLFEYRASDFDSALHAGVGGLYAGAGRSLELDLGCADSLARFSFQPGRYVASRYLLVQAGDAWVESPDGERHDLHPSSPGLGGWTMQNGPWGFHVDPSVRVDQWGEAQVFGVCMPRIAPGEHHPDWYDGSP